jgi:hypothetical protein
MPWRFGGTRSVGTEGGVSADGGNRLLVAVVLAALYTLHQDIWFWRAATPLVFGVLPIGLAYHAAFTLATSLVLWWLVRRAWPAHLEDSARR